MLRSEMETVRRIVREELHALLTEIQTDAEYWNDYDTPQIEGIALGTIASTIGHVLGQRAVDAPADKSDDARDEGTTDGT
jgi:hypothetical protein